jgi:peptidoglycan hydrolase CwlO-like protein
MIILNSLEEKLIFSNYEIAVNEDKITARNKFYKCRARAVIPEEYAHVDYLTNIDVLGLTKYQSIY